MDRKEAAILAITKLVLPTIDVFTDWLFGIQPILGLSYDPQSKEYKLTITKPCL